MDIPSDDLISVLSQFNPWWRNADIADLPNWKRAVFKELFRWAITPPAPRAVLLSGARQVGKTTLLMQVIHALLQEGVPAANILYATFDHPIIKLAGIEAVLKAWREREPKVTGFEYVFLDEAQFVGDRSTWIKHQVDFVKSRRIFFTGSAMPLIQTDPESGVGRWHTIPLATLSFYEYLQLKAATETSLEIPELPFHDLNDLFTLSKPEIYRVKELAVPYVGHFHEYLLRGGFPQTAQIESIHQAQKLLREDIVDKVLKRDMTVLFGVRRVDDLEKTFLYLCMHDGGLLDVKNLCENLEVKRPTAMHFIELLQAAHLIYRLQPFGYGKEILRAKYKIYLADAAIAPAVFLKGKSILNDPVALGTATETCVFKHIFAHYPDSSRLTYWQNEKKEEVDIVVEREGKIIPFEIKYRNQHTGVNALKGLIDLCEKKNISQGFMITKALEDFGILELKAKTKIMRIPAPIFCYWLGQAE